MIDQALEALKIYNWGTDPNVLNPINEAVIASRGDAALRTDLETRLAALLKADVSRDAKDFICRKLMVIGTAVSTPELAALLPQAEHSHMARYALERMPAPEAAQALRDALPNLSGPLKVGVIGSLGVRRDAASVPTLTVLLGDADTAVARAAALALGTIGTPEAAQALTQAQTAGAGATVAVTDARLACAESSLAAGSKAEALAIYKSLSGEEQPQHVRLAATRGMLACAGS